MLNASAKPAPEPIAIVGLSGYFPQCANVQEFWDAVDKDKCLIEKMPADRNAWAGWAGTIPNIRDFDPAFFGILPGTAHLMDPRKRLLLMCVYHAIEDAGYAPLSLKNTNTAFLWR
jgi:acyl transferase domain-containing protein